MPIKSKCITTHQHDIEYLLCHVGLLWRRLLNAKIKALGVSGTEKRILFCILTNPGLTQIQIATMLDIEPQNLMRSLDKLEKRNWVQKKISKSDRRHKHLYTTAHAKKIISRIQKLSDGIRPNILANIDAKHIHLVNQQLAIVRENLLSELEKIEAE